MTDPRPTTPFTRVDLLLASEGSVCLGIAELLRAGFETLGLPAAVRCAEPPDDDPACLSLVVGADEYADFLDGHVDRSEWTDLAARLFTLNTASPGTRQFDRSLEFGLRTRGIFDMFKAGADATLGAMHAPLGYHPSLETRPEDAADAGDKPLDIIFIGHESEDRGRFFADYREAFKTLACQIHFVPRDACPEREEIGERQRLLRQAKVFLQLASPFHGGFDELMTMTAMANGAVCVTDRSDHLEHAAQHVVVAPRPELAATCRQLAEDAEVRTDVAEAARACLLEWPITKTCQMILEHAAAEPKPRQGAIRRTLHRVKAGLRDATSPRGWAAPETSFRLAFQAGHLARLTTYRLFRRGELAEMDRRRAEILNRQKRQWEAEEPLFKIQDNPAFDLDAEPNVSVLITLYNYRDRIIECLDSVAASSLESIPNGVEIIVVNDGSTDDSKTVVEAWMESATVPVRLVDKTYNTGLGEARNVGFALARGPYVFVLDADNVVYPNGLAKLYEAIQGTNAAAVYGMLAAFDHDTGEGRTLLSALPWDVSRLVENPYIDAMAMFGRDQILGLGGYAGDLVRFGWFGWEDYDLWLSLAKAGLDVRLHPEVVGGYRVHSTSNANASKIYTPHVAEFFRKKFAALLEDVEPGPSQFGAPIPRKTTDDDQAAA